jgi:hypothetical protein
MRLSADQSPYAWAIAEVFGQIPNPAYAYSPSIWIGRATSRVFVINYGRFALSFQSDRRMLQCHSLISWSGTVQPAADTGPS